LEEVLLHSVRIICHSFNVPITLFIHTHISVLSTSCLLIQWQCLKCVHVQRSDCVLTWK